MCVCVCVTAEPLISAWAHRTPYLGTFKIYCIAAEQARQRKRNKVARHDPLLAYGCYCLLLLLLLLLSFAFILALQTPPSKRFCSPSSPPPPHHCFFLRRVSNPFPFCLFPVSLACTLLSATISNFFLLQPVSCSGPPLQFFASSCTSLVPLLLLSFDRILVPSRRGFLSLHLSQPLSVDPWNFGITAASSPIGFGTSDTVTARHPSLARTVDPTSLAQANNTALR